MANLVAEAGGPSLRSNPLRARWLQMHLSTAVLLSLSAGALLYLETQIGWKHDYQTASEFVNANERMQMRLRNHDDENYRRLNRLDYDQYKRLDDRHYGWPSEFYAVMRAEYWKDSKRVENALDIETQFLPEPLIFDIACCLAVLLFVLMFSEGWIRRCEVTR